MTKRHMLYISLFLTVLAGASGGIAITHLMFFWEFISIGFALLVMSHTVDSYANKKAKEESDILYKTPNGEYVVMAMGLAQWDIIFPDFCYVVKPSSGFTKCFNHTQDAYEWLKKNKIISRDELKYLLSTLDKNDEVG